MEEQKKHEDVAPLIISEAVIESPTIYVRTYHSPYHLWAAKHFSALAAAREARPGERPRFDIEQRSLVTIAVLASVAFIEAAINEVYQDAADVDGCLVPDGPPRERLKALWREIGGGYIKPLSKYQLALASFGKPQFNTGAMPYQDAALLVKLRNELMHAAPMTQGGGVEHRFVKKLMGKFPDNKLMNGAGNPWFPDKCLGAGCASWAVESSVALTDCFALETGLTLRYQKLGASSESKET